MIRCRWVEVAQGGGSSCSCAHPLSRRTLAPHATEVSDRWSCGVARVVPVDALAHGVFELLTRSLIFCFNRGQFG
jgi:hypothetical protein